MCGDRESESERETTIQNCTEGQERLKETKETIETVETSDMQIQNCMERRRPKETKGNREIMETSVEIHECNVYGGTEGLERL